MPLEISWEVIFKVIAGGLFTYAIFPLVLVGRDLLILKGIEKWIINSDLNSKIRICELDRWYLDNKYNKRVEVNLRNDGNVYKIDDEIVSHDVFEEYDRGKKFHQDRFYPIDQECPLQGHLANRLHL